MQVIILMGAPGAGKGTQAARLSAHASLAHISTGDLFRENLKQETALGKKVKGYMESGNLVPDELVLDMLFDRVSRKDCAAGYILDGFPRTVPQAEALGERLGDSVELLALNLEVPDDLIVERASGRLLCRGCSHIHHAKFSPPKAEGVCDNCGGELYQRKDDAADVVGQRLAVYHEQTAPVEKFYGAQGVLKSINGVRSPDEVFTELISHVPAKEKADG